MPAWSCFVRRRASSALAVVAAFCVLALGADGLAGPTAPRVAAEEGAAAPQDGWITEGGCASRTSRGSARALDGPMETAWTQTMPGAIGGEPLVTGSSIVLDVAGTGGQRSLTVLDLSTGRPVAKRQVKASDPLLATIVGGFVVARTGANRIGAYRIRGTQLVELWNQDVGAPVESVLAMGGAVFIRSARAVTRWEIGAREPTWTAPCERPRGRLAGRGGHVYAIDYDTDGNGALVALDRRDGSIDARCAIGHHDGAVPTPTQDPLIFVGERSVFITHTLGIPTKSGRSGNVTCVKRTARADGAVTLADGGLRFGRDLPFSVGDRWLLAVEDEKGEILFEERPDADSGRILASTERHPEWLRGMSRAAFSGGVLYHQQGALELSTSRILWSPDAPWSFRPVPVRGMLLVVQGATVLRALREVATTSGATAADPGVDIGAGLGKDAAPAQAVLRDGTVVTGPMRRTADGVVVDAKPPRTIAGADLLLVEDANGRLLRAVPGADLATAIEVIADDRVGGAAGKALVDALGSRDAALLRRLLGEALLRGAPAADVERAEKRIRDLLRPGKPLPADDAAAAAAATRFTAIGAIPAAVASDRLRSLPADAPADVVLSLLRIVLRLDRTNADAAARVRALLPAGVTPAEPFDALDWIDFIEAIRTTPVEVIRPVPANHPGITPAQRTVSLLAMQWRQDVVGLQSKQLLMVTSVRRPGAIARCLSLGELVCSMLDKWFEKGTRKRATREPLAIVLYPTQEEFEAESVKHGHGDVAWAAGFYSPSEELSRLFLPEDDEDFQGAIGVFAHELTHQWIDQRCPTFGFVDRKSSARTPGYWIVEGFATFVEELRLDPRRGTWAFDPWNSPVEIAATADPKGMLPWSRLLTLTHGQFSALSDEPKLQVPFVRRLGFHRQISELRLFYDQAAAVCCYLFESDGGAHRGQLLDYLTAYYRGDPPSIDVAFGMSADELGRRVRAWSQEKSRGAR